MHSIKAIGTQEHQRSEVRQIPVAAGTVAQPPRAVPQIGNKLADVMRRHAGVHDEDNGHDGGQRDRCEIPHQVVGQLPVENGAGRDGGDVIEHRVSVRLGPRDGLGRDVPVGAEAVLDDGRLPESLAHALRQHACDEISRPARR